MGFHPILVRKNGFDHEIGRVNKSLPFDRINRGALQNAGVVFLREEKPRDAFYMTRGKQRGIPTHLANALGMNRQSVEKTLRAGDVFLARNMALDALKEMREIGGKMLKEGLWALLMAHFLLDFML